MKLHAFGLGEHTLDVERLTPNSWVLDVGCRGFEFAREMNQYGPRVFALDPSRHVTDPGLPGTRFYSAALGPGSAVLNETLFCECPDGSASHLLLERPASPGRIHGVKIYTIEQVQFILDIRPIAAIKLDCEGAEYAILREWPGPIADQITVAFHDFITPGVDRSAACVQHLSQWYDVVQHEATVRHGHETPCHWDSLFVLR